MHTLPLPFYICKSFSISFIKYIFSSPAKYMASNGSKSNGIPKFKLFTISLLSLLLSLLVLTSTFRLKLRRPTIFTTHWKTDVFLSINGKGNFAPKKSFSSPLVQFLYKEFDGKDIKIGLVNTHDQENDEWEALGETVLVPFDRVSNETRWEDLFPEWIDEEEKRKPAKCPEIPMPRIEEYEAFDVVVARVPCGYDTVVGDHGKGTRDVFRLQVNLVIANLIARNDGSTNHEEDRTVYVVFIGSCGPMLEIFRCDDLVKHEGEFWIYKPDLRRLKQKVQMPVGTCQLATPYTKQGDGKISYDFSKLINPIDKPKEAYVTVLHSSEAYVCGAIVLAQSILQTKSTKDLILLADNSITKRSRRALKSAGWKIKLITRIRSPTASKNAYNEWNYSKLRLWQLTNYDKVIFIDSDLIILKNIDDFFVHPQISAVRNNKMIFNSGIMIIEPSKCMFETLMKKRHTVYSYNGGDQGFLTEVFTWWHRWPGKLNYLKSFETETIERPEVPEDVYAVHYLGLKPWMCYKDYDCNWDILGKQVFASDSANKKWWQVYDKMPKRLTGFCDLSKTMDERIKLWRNIAKNESLADEHWKIKVTDPRQHY